MRLPFVLLLIVLLLPACQLTSKKPPKKKTLELAKRQPLITLIPPELLGQECIVQERVEDEKVARIYTGKLIKFNDEVIELESPRQQTKTEREPPLLGSLFKNSASASVQLEQNKFLMRAQVASIEAAPSNE